MPSIATENERLIRRCFRQLHEQGNTEVADEIFHPDVEHTTIHGGTITGTDAIKQAVRGLNSAFPDFEYEIETLVADSDTVAVYGTARGTHEGQWDGYDPTGETLEWTLTAFFTIENGLITEVWAFQDRQAWRRQIADAAEE